MPKIVAIAYTKHNVQHEFLARDIEHAREIAKRIITEGLWVVQGTEETFFPTERVFKVKILRTAEEIKKWPKQNLDLGKAE